MTSTPEMAQHVPIILPKPVIKDYFLLPNLIILINFD